MPCLDILTELFKYRQWQGMMKWTQKGKKFHTETFVLKRQIKSAKTRLIFLSGWNRIKTMGFHFSHSSRAFYSLYFRGQRQTNAWQLHSTLMRALEYLVSTMCTETKSFSVNNRCSGFDKLQPRAKPELEAERLATDSRCKLHQQRQAQGQTKRKPFKSTYIWQWVSKVRMSTWIR